MTTGDFFSDVPGRFDVKDTGLVVFGGAVPPARPAAAGPGPHRGPACRGGDALVAGELAQWPSPPPTPPAWPRPG